MSSRDLSVADLLIELGTEELPPKALKQLSAEFLNGVVIGLKEAGLLSADANTEHAVAYATPRRLAMIIKNVATQQADREVEKRGPAIQAAFDAQGKLSKAAEGFARSCGVSAEQLGRIKTDKGEWLGFIEKETGKATTEIVPKIVAQALAKLPIPKRMRWGDRKEEFVRPVHWVVMLLGKDVIEAPILGIMAGCETRGHRFHAPQAIKLQSPQDYIEVLRKAFVIADMEERKRSSIKANASSTADFAFTTSASASAANPSNSRKSTTSSRSINIRNTPSAARRNANGSFSPDGFCPIAKIPSKVSSLSASANI